MTPQESAAAYMDMIRQGVPAADAFKKAFPNGLPKAQDFQKKQAKDAQKGQLAQIGGAVGGVAGGKAVMDAMSGTGWFAKTKPIIDTATGIGPVADGAAYGTSVANANGAMVVNGPIADPSGYGYFLNSSSAAPTAGAPTATSTAAPTASTMGATPFYVPAAAAIGTYLAGKSAYDQVSGKPEDTSAPGRFGRAQLAFTTMGGSEIARALGIGGTDTRLHAKQNTKKLLGVSNDPTYQSYVQGMRAQYNSAPTDPSKPFAGKYASWDEYKKAGLQANDLTGVLGNIKTFGSDWTKYSQAQREAITQGVIDAGLYDSKKGEVVITDENAAKGVRDKLLTALSSKPQQPKPATRYDVAINKQNNDAALKIQQALSKR